MSTRWGRILSVDGEKIHLALLYPNGKVSPSVIETALDQRGEVAFCFSDDVPYVRLLGGVLSSIAPKVDDLVVFKIDKDSLASRWAIVR